MPSVPRAKRLLTDVRKVAEQAEGSIHSASLSKSYARFAAGTLVRSRRLAHAVHGFSADTAYESRPLIRSMIELVGNLEWVRLNRPDLRANRFVRFLSLEHLLLLERMPTQAQPAGYPRLRRQVIRDRAKVRHLFRRKTSGSSPRLVWDRSWAQTSSFDARLQAVQKSYGAQGLTVTNPYFYYSWFSSAVHGGPVSFAECVSFTASGVTPTQQPEPNPDAPFSVAATCLLNTLSIVVDDLGLPYAGNVAALERRARNYR